MNENNDDKYDGTIDKVQHNNLSHCNKQPKKVNAIFITVVVLIIALSAWEYSNTFNHVYSQIKQAFSYRQIQFTTVDNVKNSIDRYFKTNNLDYKISEDRVDTSDINYDLYIYNINNDCKLSITTTKGTKDAHTVIMLIPKNSKNISKEWPDIKKALITNLSKLQMQEVDNFNDQFPIPTNQSKNVKKYMNGLYYESAFINNEDYVFSIFDQDSLNKYIGTLSAQNKIENFTVDEIKDRYNDYFKTSNTNYKIDNFKSSSFKTASTAYSSKISDNSAVIILTDKGSTKAKTVIGSVNIKDSNKDELWNFIVKSTLSSTNELSAEQIDKMAKTIPEPTTHEGKQVISVNGVDYFIHLDTDNSTMFFMAIIDLNANYD